MLIPGQVIFLATVILFHSVCGLRRGVLLAADRLRRSGHTVYTPDLYDGAVFDDFAEAQKMAESLGIRELVSRTIAAVQDLPEEVVYAGFSNGGASAELLAATRNGTKGCLMFHAALPLDLIGVPVWPSSVPVQVHYADRDPFRNDAWIASFAASVRESGAPYEYYGYPAAGHLFADPDLPDFNRVSADLMWRRVIAFLKAVDEE